MLQGAMSPRPREIALAFVAALALCLFIQAMGNAFSTDLSAHPDEPAHAVTGLMVRDYIAGGFLETPNPLTFARGYYERFPKVALGHYPPAFYAIEGLWLIPARSIAAAITLVAATAALWLTLTFWALRASFPDLPRPLLALPVTAIAFVPLVGDSLVMVMSDLQLATFCLAATLAFSRFVEKPTARNALGFGILASAAGLTKASGLLLAFIPPLTCLLAGKWRLLLNPRLWLGAVPVALTVIPWVLATRHITQEGMRETPLSEFLPQALRYYPAVTLEQLAAPASILIAVGFVTILVTGARKRALEPVPAALLALAASTFAFYVAVPAGLEPRYLLPVLPTFALFATAATAALCKRLPQRARPVAIAAIAIAAVVPMAALPEPVGSGFHAPVSSLLNNDHAGQSTTLLISSDAVGEGATIAAVAFGVTPAESQDWRVLRSTKILSTSDWMGRGYTPTVSTVDELASLLDTESVTHILSDSSVPQRLRLPHQDLVDQLIERDTPAAQRSQFPIARTGHSDREGDGPLTLAPLPPASQP